MLEKIKMSLRIKHTALDDELIDMIAAAKKDLARVGIINIADEDTLIIQAVKLYCKWHLNYESDTDRYKEAYTSMAQSLSMSGDYSV